MKKKRSIKTKKTQNKTNLKRSQLFWVVVIVIVFFVSLLEFLLFQRKYQKNSYIFRSSSRITNSQNINVPEITIEEGDFYNPTLFLHTVNQFEPTLDSLSARGIIIPHHLLASELIAEGISYLNSQQVETIIVISPNHHEVGQQLIQSSYATWVTAHGKVEAEVDSVIELERLMNLSADDQDFFGVNHQSFEREHGIAGLVPFFQYYLPKARIFPLIIKGGGSTEQLQQILTGIDQLFLTGFLDKEKTAVVGSIDFSHELLPKQAEKNNEITKKFLLNQDWDNLYKLNNEYLDSPASAYLTHQIAEYLGATAVNEIANTNSGKLFNIYDKGCVSYFVFLFEN